LKGPSPLIVGFDEGQESLHEFVSRFENPAADDLAREDAEPNFNLVKPAGMGGSEGEVKALLFRYPRQGFLAPMGGAVIGNDVEILSRIRVEKSTQEADEGQAIVATDGFSPKPDLAGFGRRPMTRRRRRSRRNSTMIC
jgi:hypothetical protein